MESNMTTRWPHPWSEVGCAKLQHLEFREDHRWTFVGNNRLIVSPAFSAKEEATEWREQYQNEHEAAAAAALAQSTTQT